MRGAALLRGNPEKVSAKLSTVWNVKTFPLRSVSQVWSLTQWSSAGFLQSWMIEMKWFLFTNTIGGLRQLFNAIMGHLPLVQHTTWFPYFYVAPEAMSKLRLRALEGRHDAMSALTRVWDPEEGVAGRSKWEQYLPPCWIIDLTMWQINVFICKKQPQIFISDQTCFVPVVGRECQQIPKQKCLTKRKKEKCEQICEPVFWCKLCSSSAGHHDASSGHVRF